MNLYFLVEGRRTERKVYPKWLSYLLPDFTQVERFDDVSDKNYFLLSGEGYPAILSTHLLNAVRDFNKVDAYSHLVVCLDADEQSVEDCVAEVETRLQETNCALAHGQLKVVVQNRTFETWFLGNKRMLTRQPQSSRLREYIEFYDVSIDDPEKMGVHQDFSNHAQFHAGYLRAMFREKGIPYTKRNPGHVMDQPYLDQLISRISDEPDHLHSFQSFIEFCEHIARISGPI